MWIYAMTPALRWLGKKSKRDNNMSKAAERNMVVGLDIGTSRVTALIGEVMPDGDIAVIGVGAATARGMDKGGVNDLNLVVQSIQRAVEEAELMGDCRMATVLLNISGGHNACHNESGMVPINEAEVTQDDGDSEIHAAQSVPIAQERLFLHVLPQGYILV